MKELIIITGSSGFVGSNLSEELAKKGYETLGIDKAPGKWTNVVIDIRHINKTSLPCPDTLVHLAALQYTGKRVSKKELFENNVLGTREVVFFARKCHSKFIFLSTDMVYGKPLYLPVNELHPINPVGPYGLSKVFSELVIISSGIDYIIFRPRLIGGPGRVGSLLTTYRFMKRGFPIPLPDGGKNFYQLIHVNDVVKAIVSSLENPSVKGIFNLGSDNFYSLKELLEFVSKKLNLKFRPVAIHKDLFRLLASLPFSPLTPEQAVFAANDFFVSVENAKEELNWVPTKDDKDTLLETFLYFENTQNNP